MLRRSSSNGIAGATRRDRLSEPEPEQRPEPRPLPEEVLPRPAAALIVAREGARGPEFLLLKRSASARFMPEVYVFPGGVVDLADGCEQSFAACTGLDDLSASRALGLEEQGLSFFIAAIRETFEECGLLYACAHSGSLVRQEDLAAPGALNPSAPLLAAVCAARGWRLAVDRLIYFGHWITPPGSPRRFDTRFFLAPAPEGQNAALMSDEMQELIWLGAREALQYHARGRLLLVSPTVASLEEMAPFASLAALMAYARAPRIIEAIMPAD